MRLDLAQRLPLEPAHAGNAVRPRSALELPQPVELALVERDDELAALLVREAALREVGAQQADAAAAELRLERARRVVDAGVDDAAVAAGLVERQVVLLLQHGHRRVGAQLGEPPRHREADDPGADDPDPQRSHWTTSVPLRS